MELVIIIIIALILSFLLTLLGLLLARSSGKPLPFLGEDGKTLPGSISEKVWVIINGARQGMFIKGTDKTKPVLLFLHGGPGFPEYSISWKYPRVLEDLFTVCWWEQRGDGLSFDPNLPPETITLAQLVDDTITLTNHLCNRFGREKIYLMAHSGGTFIGIQAAARAPELYHAYLGMAQITRQMESEKLAYSHMLAEYAKKMDKRMLGKLEKVPLLEMDSMPPVYRRMRDEVMHPIGIGTTRTMMSVEKGIFLPAMESREYTLREKINIWRGKWSAYTTAIWNEILKSDIPARVPKLEIPAYFFSGIYDYTVNYALSKEYFEKLQAPLKKFYTFEQSAHSPLFEEPEKLRKILEEDVLGT